MNPDFKMYFPIENGDNVASYVSLPQGILEFCIKFPFLPGAGRRQLPSHA